MTSLVSACLQKASFRGAMGGLHSIGDGLLVRLGFGSITLAGGREALNMEALRSGLLFWSVTSRIDPKAAHSAPHLRVV